MSAFYQKMRGTATKLLNSELGQDDLTLLSDGAPAGQPWNPQPGAPVERPFKGAAVAVQSGYVDGTLILSSDKQVTAPAFPDGHEPQAGERLRIRAGTFEVIQVHRIPEAGPVAVAWRLFVRG